MNGVEELRDLRATVRGWCGERAYTAEEFAILRRVRDELTERLTRAGVPADPLPTVPGTLIEASIEGWTNRRLMLTSAGTWQLDRPVYTEHGVLHGIGGDLAKELIQDWRIVSAPDGGAS